MTATHSNPSALESHDSIVSALVCREFVKEQPGLGRTLNRFDTFLGGKVERLLLKRSNGASNALPPIVLAGRSQVDEFVEVRTISSGIVDETRGIGRTLNRVYRRLGRPDSQKN